MALLGTIAAEDGTLHVLLVTLLWRHVLVHLVAALFEILCVLTFLAHDLLDGQVCKSLSVILDFLGGNLLHPG